MPGGVSRSRRQRTGSTPGESGGRCSTGSRSLHHSSDLRWWLAETARPTPGRSGTSTNPPECLGITEKRLLQQRVSRDQVEQPKTKTKNNDCLETSLKQWVSEDHIETISVQRAQGNSH